MSAASAWLAETDEADGTEVMKVLSRGRDGKGMIYLDPIRLPEIITNAARGFANGVLSGEHLIASTIECSSHHESTDAAGIHLQDIDWNDPVPGVGDIRLQMDAETVEAEFWYHDEDEDIAAGICPLGVDQLGRVTDYIAAHPKIRQAFLGGPAPTVQVTMMYDSTRFWLFKEGEIHETENTPKPGGMAP